MSLPATWEEAGLLEIADSLDAQRVPVNRTERDSRRGPVPYYGATGQVGWIDRPLFNEELCLVGEDGAPFLDRAKPKAYLIDGPSWVNNHAHVLRALRGTTSNRFLKYALDQVDYTPFVNGTTRLKLTKAAMGLIRIPLPPAAEQARIVAAIEEQFSRLDAGVTALERVRLNLKRARAAVLQAAVDGRLCAPAGRTALRSWRRLPVGDVISFLDQGWSPRCERAPSLDERSWGVIKTSAVQPMRFDGTQNKRLPAGLAPRTEYEVAAGDLLITRAGPRSRAGVCCLVRESRSQLMICDKVYRFRVANALMLPEFLELALNAPETVSKIDSIKTGMSDSGVNLTQKTFQALEVPVPAVGEQAMIVAEVERELSKLEVLDQLLVRIARRSDRLRSAVLAKAFSGKLVPQDPADEPAPTLLERIAAARASQPKVARRRRRVPS